MNLVHLRLMQQSHQYQDNLCWFQQLQLQVPVGVREANTDVERFVLNFIVKVVINCCAGLAAVSVAMLSKKNKK
jgi:hypothetical protein